MVLKMFFDSSLEEFKKPLNKEVNGFVMNLLGKDNNYHGNKSDYCISSIQGGVCNDNGTTSFPNGAIVAVSSNNPLFISIIIDSLISNTSELKIASLTYEKMEMTDYNPFSDYDVVRSISPISLKSNGRFCTCEDSNFVSVLQKHCINKLIQSGVSEKAANTITIEPFHFEGARKVCVKIDEAKNISSNVMLIVKGNKNARKQLYNMGMGRCTGFGFGFVEVRNRNMF